MRESEEDSDQEPSVDDILRELCLLRCSSCKTTSSRPTSSRILSQQDIKEELSLVRLDQTLVSPPCVSIKEEDVESETVAPERIDYWETQSSLDLNSLLHEEDQDPSPSGITEFLLSGRCTSPDCGCDKRQQSSSSTSLQLEKKLEQDCWSNSSTGLWLISVASQTSNTSLSQKICRCGHFTMGNSMMKHMEDSDSLPSCFKCDRISEICSSECFFDFIRNCSDPNLLTTIGLDRDPRSSRRLRNMNQCISSSLPGGIKSKSQMVETYGKLLHKIEKLKKMASWKSKRRKRKMKYTLDGSEEFDVLNMSDSKTERSDKQESPGRHRREAKTCDVAVQSLYDLINAQKPLDNMLSLKEESKGKSFKEAPAELSCAELSSSESAEKRAGNSTNITKEEKEKQTEAAYSRNEAQLHHVLPASGDGRQRKQEDLEANSSSDFILSPSQDLQLHPCSHGDEEKSCRGRETDEEILDHLRQINRLIEKEYCGNCSTHRMNTIKPAHGRNSSVNVVSPRCGLDKKDRRKSDKGKQARVFWAVTKVTVYPDSCRTYEVMRLSKRRPHNVPSSSDSVFVLLPNK